MTKIIHNFSVYTWLSALMAVSFAGASFGFGGIVGAIGGFFIAGVVGFFSLSLAYNKREQKDALKTVSDGVAVAGMVIFLVMLFSTGLIIGLVALLFFLHIAINLSFREHRQVYFGLLVNFVALMAGAINTFSAGYLFFLLAFCVCACFYLALVFVDKQRYAIAEQMQEEVGASLQTLPTAVQNNMNSQVGQEVGELDYVGEWRVWDKLVMAGMISLIAGAIYLLIPHFSAGDLGRMPIKGFGKYDSNADLEEQILSEGTKIDDHFRKSDNIENSTGKENTDSAENKNNLDNNGNKPDNNENSNDGILAFVSPKEQMDNSIFYYVKSEKPRYMQIDTATYFDGSSWHRLQYGWRKLPNQPRTSDFTLYPEKPNANVSVTVVKEPQVKHLLTTDNTVGIRFPSKWLASDYYDQLKTADKLKVDTSYELMLVDKMGDKKGRMIDVNQASPDAKDLQLPNNLDPRIKQLGDKLTLNSSDEVTKANALEKHLRSSYQYTLDTVSNQNNIPLTDFLFGSQRGHCEYFATSMAIMLRQQGIPARMITGYVAHDYNPVTGFYEVKGTNGHAWVQAYVEGEWAIYEATGAYNTPQQDAQNAEKTRNTSEIIEEYLEKINEQDERLQEVQALTLWQKIQLWLRSFWYMIVAGFSGLVSFLKVVLPWLLGIGLGLGIAGWFGWQQWQSKAVERADKQGLKDLQQLANQTPQSPQEMKEYIHQNLHIYQEMLARHEMSRPVGQQIEDFASQLVSNQLCSHEQATMLINLTNGEFYLTHQNQYSADDVHELFVGLYEGRLGG